MWLGACGQDSYFKQWAGKPSGESDISVGLKEARDSAPKGSSWKRAFWQRAGQQRQRPKAEGPAVFWKEQGRHGWSVASGRPGGSAGSA